MFAQPHAIYVKYTIFLIPPALYSDARPEIPSSVQHLQAPVNFRYVYFLMELIVPVYKTFSFYDVARQGTNFIKDFQLKQSDIIYNTQHVL